MDGAAASLNDTSMTTIFPTLLAVFGAYFGVGIVFALAFALGNGAQRIDPAAHGATPGFRLIIIPGSAIFWPYLLLRWVNGSRPPEEHSAHRNPKI